MSTTMPKAVAAYFAATNRHDVSAMVAMFSDQAVVADEGQVHRGLDAIRAWASEAIRKYDFTVEPGDVTEVGGATVVKGLVSGNFPGSPARIDHAFSLDHEKILRLEIG